MKDEELQQTFAGPLQQSVLLFVPPRPPSRGRETRPAAFVFDAEGAVRRRALQHPAYWSIVKPARRFNCQQASVDSVQNGFSLP